MFQFNRNNQTYKCSPIVLEGFDGDSDNESGFICTNTKNTIENFENQKLINLFLPQPALFMEPLNNLQYPKTKKQFP
jgi:hypothetical protein